MRLAAYVIIAFRIVAALLLPESAIRLSGVWILVAMLFVSLPLGNWLAGNITGINPFQ